MEPTKQSLFLMTAEPGTTCNKLASNIDLFLTFAEITGAPLPSRKIDGVSLLSLMEGKPGANPRESFVYYYNKNDLKAVTDGVFKLQTKNERSWAMI